MPESAIVADAFAALLVNKTPPVRAPAVAGAKVAVPVVLCPGFRMTPLDTPVALNPAPETLTWDNVIAAVPVFDTVNVCDAVVPISTLPKAKLVGLSESWPCADDAEDKGATLRAQTLGTSADPLMNLIVSVPLVTLTVKARSIAVRGAPAAATISKFVNAGAPLMDTLKMR